MKKLLSIIAILLFTSNCFAGNGHGSLESVYQNSDDFLAEVFSNDSPKAKIIWPNKSLNKKIVEILGHKYNRLRIRYWQKDSRTAWILDEIGKEKPITTGIVINNQKIERVRVLIFRESRGWEVRHTFFTKQFNQASLETDMSINNNIDNISGATLSVRAVTKLARLALLLDAHITSSEK